MPPNMNARYTGTSVSAKMTPNTALTHTNAPSDSVMVVTIICLPELFIRFQMSSEPIINPTVHSSTLSVTLYHFASSSASSISPSA